jgi:hypothetical protein
VREDSVFASVRAASAASASASSAAIIAAGTPRTPPLIPGTESQSRVVDIRCPPCLRYV